MKNADQPAYPTLLYNEANGEANGHRQGLTKREMFAAMMMQGMLSNTNIGNALRNEGVVAGEADQSISITSIRLADELLKQLES